MTGNIKLSFSVAKQWWAGQRDKAVAMLCYEDIQYPLKQERAMAYGTGFHKLAELESNITGRLPAIFKLPTFTVLSSEARLQRRLPTGDLLSGRFDAIAVDTDREMVCICDLKTGTGYDDKQADVYSYLVYDEDDVHLNPWWLENIGEFPPTHFLFLTFDKKTEETNTVIINLSYPKTDDDWELPEATSYTRGGNWICSVASDIKSHDEILETLSKKGRLL
jgi:hypothetical protein